MAKCRLTERITFIEEVVTQNEGFENKTINDVATFWAARKDISGKEFTSNYQTNYEKIITFTVRGCKFTRSLVPNKFKIKIITIKTIPAAAADAISPFSFVSRKA